MNASDVIKMGRKRMRAASTAASTTDMPLLRSLFRKLDNQKWHFYWQDRISITRPIWQ